MTRAKPESLVLARHLLALESAHTGVPQQPAVARVCAKLASTLTVYTGAAGVRLLLMRALALARAQAPSLSHLEVLENGSLAGHQPTDNSERRDNPENDDHILIAHLLDLLTTFIGDRLMEGLVRDAWPEMPPAATAPPATAPPSPSTSRTPRSRVPGSKNKDNP